MIAVSSPGAENALVRAELEAALHVVLERGRYILGPEVEAFEGEFAAFVGVPYAVGVASGTDALTLALAACGVGPGDEVLTVSHTAVATVAAIVRVGAVPVLLDIEQGTYCMDPALLERHLTPRTKAIVPVHLYGNAADVEAISEFARQHGLRVVEDCCQAHGTRNDGVHVGATADAAAFSFYPTKNLGALGDGGLIATRDPVVAETARLLREYGWRERYVSDLHGWNSRLDELQAAVLRVKLRSLPELLGRRRQLAARYLKEISLPGLSLPQVAKGVEHSFHLFVVRSVWRDQLARHLESAGIGSLVHYPVPVHKQPAYAGVSRFGNLGESERAAREVLSLPLHGALPDEDADRVIRAVNSFGADSMDEGA